MPLTNFGSIAFDQNVARFHNIYRGAQPDQDGCDFLHFLGVKTVFKLSSEEEFSWRKYQTMFDPSARCQVIEEPMPKIFRAEETEHVVKIIERVRAAHLAGSVFINCHHGCDRTGIVSACLRLATGGNTLEQALENRRVFGVSALRDIIDFEDHPVILEINRRVQSGEIAKL